MQATDIYEVIAMEMRIQFGFLILLGCLTAYLHHQPRVNSTLGFISDPREHSPLSEGISGETVKNRDISSRGSKFHIQSNFFPCSMQNLTASYVTKRKTGITPKLELYDGASQRVCGFVKLSCSLLVNTVETISAESHSVTDHAWGEILSNYILGLSDVASSSRVNGGGIVIHNATEILDDKDIYAIPSSCWWRGDTLSGYIMEYIDDMVKSRVSSTLNVGDDVALASIWILDSVMMKQDRSDTKNIFRDKKGMLLAMDFDKWFRHSLTPLPCPGSEEGKRFALEIGKNVRSARVMKPLPFCLDAFKSVADTALRILHQLCQEKGCVDMARRLHEAISHDAWFTFALQEISHKRADHHICCCDRDLKGKMYTLKKQCYLCGPSVFAQMFQQPVNESCMEYFGGDNVFNALAEVASSRIEAFKSALEGTPCIGNPKSEQRKLSQKGVLRDKSAHVQGADRIL